MYDFSYHNVTDMNKFLVKAFKECFNVDQKYIPQLNEEEKHENLRKSFKDLMNCINPLTNQTNKQMILGFFPKLIDRYETLEYKGDLNTPFRNEIFDHPGVIAIELIDKEAPEERALLERIHELAILKNDMPTQFFMSNFLNLDNKQLDQDFRKYQTDLAINHVLTILKQDGLLDSKDECHYVVQALKQTMESISSLKDCLLEICMGKTLTSFAFFAEVAKTRLLVPTDAEKENNENLLDFLLKRKIKLKQEEMFAVLQDTLKNGNPVKFELLLTYALTQGFKINTVDAEGETLLMGVARKEKDDDFDKLQSYCLLVEKGCDPHIRNKKGQSLIMIAALHHNDFALLNAFDVHEFKPAELNEALFVAGTACLARDQSAYTSKEVILGETKGEINRYSYNLKFKTTIELLIKKGAHIDAKDENGDTLLQLAVKAKDAEAVALLLYYGASPLVRNKAGKNTFDFISEKNDPQIFKLLNQAVRSMQPGFDWTLFSVHHQSKSVSRHTRTSKSKDDFFQHIPAAVIHSVGQYLSQNDRQSLRLVNRDLKGIVPFVSKQEIETATKLLESKEIKFDKEALSNDAKTFVGVLQQQKELLIRTIQTAIDKNEPTVGASIELFCRIASNNEDKSWLRQWLWEAIRFNKDAAAVAFLKQGVNPNINALPLIFTAIDNANVTIVKALLAAGADVDALNSKHETALMAAIQRNSFNKGGGLETNEIISLLISRGARLDIKNSRGYSAWGLALFHKRTLTIRYFLHLQEQGVDIGMRERNDLGETYLFAAIKNQIEDNIKYRALCASSRNTIFKDVRISIFSALHHYRNRINFNEQDQYGETMLMFAIRGREFELATYLLDNGANPLLKNKEGKTAVEMMNPTDNERVFKLLSSCSQSEPPAEVKTFNVCRVC